MEHTFAHSDVDPAESRGFPTTDRPEPPRILIVEDDPDIRELLSTLLHLAGFGCVVCDSAEAGLTALREQPVDLILTDYALPTHTGLWLLERAESEGLIEGTPVMIVTAYPDPARGSTYEVVQKPFDLDDLVSRVKRRMGDKGADRRAGGKARTGKKGGGRTDQRDPDCPEPVELILYVSSQSLASAAAIKNIQKVLSRFASGRVKLTVCDLSENPSQGLEHRVAFTPTLVRKAPAPKTYILGHITSPELLLELLSDCELEGN
jgi:DNA-binding response OmpR family regulator